MRTKYEGLGYWELPKPDKGKEREWHKVARVSRTVPFGYKVDEKNNSLLEPVFIELEALELAKRHLKQYTYKDVAIWLTKQTGRYISSEGLRKRIKVEQRRKRSAKIKRELARRLKKTLKEIQKLEKEGVGSYSNRKRTT
jgi:hypothetical protein